jgi:hypothetical protein
MNFNQPIRIRKKYTRYTDGNVHPMVKGEICWEQKRQPITLLLDSGATYSMIDRKYLSLLGIELLELPKIFSKPIQGAFGRPELVDFFKIKFILEGHEIIMPIGFINTSWNLLGRNPAFLNFSPVVFVEHEERFVLEYKPQPLGRKNEF